MHFPPCFRFYPLFSKNFQTGKFSQLYLFPEIFFIFIRQNFWWLFLLVINHKFWISPYFPCFSTFPPLFRENYYFPPALTNSPCFRQFHLLFTYFTYISFPPTLTMMHLCIIQCAYWTPLLSALAYRCAVLNARTHACMHVYCIHNLDICIKTLVYALLYLINATNVDIKVLLKVDRA